MLAGLCSPEGSRGQAILRLHQPLWWLQTSLGLWLPYPRLCPWGHIIASSFCVSLVRAFAIKVRTPLDNPHLEIFNFIISVKTHFPSKAIGPGVRGWGWACLLQGWGGVGWPCFASCVAEGTSAPASSLPFIFQVVARPASAPLPGSLISSPTWRAPESSRGLPSNSGTQFCHF